MTRQVGSSAPPGWERLLPSEVAAAWKPQSVELGSEQTTRAVALGTGPPLLLVPPLVGWKESLCHQAYGFSARFRTVVYDLRERPPDRPTWQLHLLDLDHVAATLAPGRLALLGHSLGAALAVQWTLRRPQRVAALVLSSMYTHVRFDPATWRTRFVMQGIALAMNRWLPEAAMLRAARWMAQHGVWVYDRHCDDPLLRLVRASVRAAGLRGVRSRVALARSFDARPLLGQVCCSTLVVVGALESRFARESAETLAAGIAGAELRVIREANHLVHLSRPALYNEVVGAWLERRLGPDGQWRAGSGAGAAGGGSPSTR